MSCVCADAGPDVDVYRGSRQRIGGKTWERKLDSKTDKPYYYTIEEQVAQWEPPAGWHEANVLDGIDVQAMVAESGGRNVHPDFPDLPFDGYLECPYFAKINTEYPGLQLIHERPYIFVVNDFLNEEECAALIAKASTGMKKQSCDTRSENAKRTSSGVVCENEEVPGFHSRITELTHQPASHLQHLKISRYEEHDEFTLHTDAIVPHKSLCDYADMFADAIQKTEGNIHCKPNHNRHMTVFVYLNDVERGGCTAFPQIGIHYGLDKASFYDKPGPFNCTEDHEGNKPYSTSRTVKKFCEPTLRVPPQRGLAVIHFPSFSAEHGGTVDGNVTHESEPAVDTKFICQQFIYSSEDCKRDKKSLPSGRLSDYTF